MSANIGTNKLKFSVFGKGFDDTRNDSGDGYAETVDNYAISEMTGAIDQTGEFVWFARSGLVKKRVDDMTTVAQSVYNGSTSSFVGKPCNVDNNYGFFMNEDNEFKIFDLTDGTIIQSGTQTNLYYICSRTCDIILVGTKIYLITLSPQRWDQYIAWFDITDGTSSCTFFDGQVAISGFADESTILVQNIPQWFSDSKGLSAYNLSHVRKWLLWADIQGGGGFPNCEYKGFGANGKMYLPVKTYGKWRMGVFSASHAPSINGTPHPISTFGEFASQPDFYWRNNQRYGLAFTDGKKDVAFLTNLGLYWSDFKDVIKITSDEEIPIAMNDKVIFTTNYVYGRIRKFTYR